MGRLYCSDNKVVAGVCAGIAESLKWNVGMFRVLFLVITLLTFGATIIAYLILCFLMPANKKTRKNYEERMREKLGK